MACRGLWVHAVKARTNATLHHGKWESVVVSIPGRFRSLSASYPLVYFELDYQTPTTMAIDTLLEYEIAAIQIASQETQPNRLHFYSRLVRMSPLHRSAPIGNTQFLQHPSSQPFMPCVPYPQSGECENMKTLHLRTKSAVITGTSTPQGLFLRNLGIHVMAVYCSSVGVSHGL